MAKKGASEKAMPAMKLPMDPKMLGAIVVVIIIVAAVFMLRGPKVAEETEILTPPAPPTPSVTPAQPAVTYECTTNIQCNDNNECTTDSCAENVCQNTPEPDCQVATEQEPKISAVNFGAREDEFVQLEGKNWFMDDWTITNGKGEEYIKFAKSGTLVNKIDGKWTIYAKCGLSTSTIKYTCKDTGFFSDTGDKAVLKDEAGNVISEMAS